MSQLGEIVLKSLVLLKNRRRTTKVSSQNEDWDAYVKWQYESSERLFSKYPNFDVRGKEVLEIGCGTGGRTAFLAMKGAKRIVGIDINAQEIRIARDVCLTRYPEIQGRCEYLVSAEDAPLNIGQFDIVIMTDCMEHVVSPPRMMRLGFDYTKPGGRFYYSSVGWYHYLGSHMDLIPYVNVFFSDETIINVERWKLSRPDYLPNRWDSNPPAARWEGIYNLRDRPGEHLNKLTLREMKKLLRYSAFSKARLTVLGFGAGHPIFRPLDPLRHLPGIQEIYHSLVVAECQR
jgi:2-polyprenyl-3-methyl-5-hydroxy-6-metoxy-1,4-benzoquinol methylase